ncbi:MAG: YggS family pyridoxal phosphate-dependent enzyme [Actinobacteria bacterium]|nr:YggS family pyridoxal phosphate-dependent enzyme [Actinomycetota bacterium]
MARVRDRIVSAGGDPARVTVVAVTKGFGPVAVAVARAGGVADLGENYAQELARKAGASEARDPGLGPAVRWHAIGRLQRNKVRSLARSVALWQSVDREPLAAEIARRCPGASVLVQVNVSDEMQKGGCAPEETSALVRAARELGLDVRGLMAVGAEGGPDAAGPGFALLRRLADDLGLEERSMGMSADLEAAVAAGSTMVRIGTALFGFRPRTASGPAGTAH